MTRTPEQIKNLAIGHAEFIANEIYGFIEYHNISDAALSAKLGCSPQAVGARRRDRYIPTLETLFRMIFAIEDLTGATFERPTFVREKPRENAVYLGKIKEK